MSKILIDEATVKLALDAMQRIEDADMDCDFLNIRQADQLEEAITALRKARAAQPAQRTWVGLTYEEAESVIDEIPGFAFGLDDGNLANGCVVLYAKAIEAKLKEKNT